MKVYDLTPRGYCHGVVRALQMVKKAILDPSYPRPIYVLGLIVHNQKISQAFHDLGVISLHDPSKKRIDLLDQIETGTVIFSAHGVSQDVMDKAVQKGLVTLNATCKDVTKVHEAIKQKLNEDYHVFYIGHSNHPEPEAILSIDPSIILVDSIQSAKTLSKTIDKPIFVTNQTTLSLFDVMPIVEALKETYPDLVFDNEICKATTLRQEAVIKQPDTDLLLVVGDFLSSNSNKLKDVSLKARRIPSYLIKGVEDINLEWLMTIESVSVTSGASTPTSVTEEVIRFLNQFDKKDPKTWDHQTKLTSLDIL